MLIYFKYIAIGLVGLLSGSLLIYSNVLLYNSFLSFLIADVEIAALTFMCIDFVTIFSIAYFFENVISQFLSDFLLDPMEIHKKEDIEKFDEMEKLFVVENSYDNQNKLKTYMEEYLVRIRQEIYSKDLEEFAENAVNAPWFNEIRERLSQDSYNRHYSQYGISYDNGLSRIFGQ